MDEMHFDIHAKAKSSRHKSFIKNYFFKRAILASELKTIFRSKNTNELCDKSTILLQKKQCGQNSNINNEEIVALYHKLSEYKFITPTQHKKKK